jgi:hypothetical protein
MLGSNNIGHKLFEHVLTIVSRNSLLYDFEDRLHRNGASSETQMPTSNASCNGVASLSVATVA